MTTSASVSSSGSPTEIALPRVSLVIPVRNEAAFIGRNLEAALAQDYPPVQLEILVADGGSTDATREIVTEVAERVAREGRGARVVLLDNPDHVMSTGVNAAIRQSSGEVVVLLGGHAELPPDYVRGCVGVLFERAVDAAGGALDPVGTGLEGEAIAATLGSPFGIDDPGLQGAASGEPFEVDTLAFGAYRRGAFERIGLFNPHMVRRQDYEFNHRLRASGGRLLLIPGLRARYYARSSLGALWRQYWRNGVWMGRFLRRCPRSIRIRHVVASLFPIALILSAVGGSLSPPVFVLFCAIVGAYLGFLLVALVTFAAQGRWRILPLVPAVLLCLHLSHGLGVWIGLEMPGVADAPRLEPAPRH